MCGIIAYIGSRNSTTDLVSGIKLNTEVMTVLDVLLKLPME